MAYTNSNGSRLFYKDLATGREKELAADGGRYEYSPVFDPVGNGLMCAKDGFVTYVPLSGGLTKRIWNKSAWSAPWDWSPDGKTLLFYARADLRTPFKGVVQQLDLDSLSATPFLDDPEFESWQAHFSHDGSWVTFNATANDGTSRIYVVPFRKAPVPRSEWIPITHGEWDDKPRFSSDDKLIFFMTGRDGRPHRLWAQKLRSDMRPDGDPVALYPPGQSQPSAALASDDISVGPRMIAFTQDETTGSIWLLEPSKAGAK
jgi:Tol biopolymer transport system component